MQIHPLYLFIAGGVAVALFLFGFFPIKIYDGLIATENDYPLHIGDIEVNVTNSYEGSVGRLVIMVIDALRQDFVYGSESSISMPYTTSVIKNQMACCMTGKADPPTVTMPRIKAMVTGSVPNFADVVLNFGSSRITEDNVLLQAKNYNSSIIFYGDDTWLKLFPNTFKRSEGTTSFFVKDYIEVDNNITRHLEHELNNSDWRIMILHYLGLDHIGHIEGPKSRLTQPKLQEMDGIIQTLHTQLLKTDKYSEKPSALLLCGDHGMKDTGSHGGASMAEVLVPIVIISPLCYGNLNDSVTSKDDIVSQIDVAATLSLLLGLPIPAGNLGKIIPQLLHKLPVHQQLYALHYNAKQVVKQYEANIAQERRREFLKYNYNEAVRLHSHWLRSNKILSTEPDEQIFILYSTVLKEMGDELAESMINFDVYLMAVCVAILWQICSILLLRSTTRNDIILKDLSTVYATFLMLIISNYAYCSIYQSSSFLCRYDLANVLVTLLLLIIASVNCIVLLTFYKNKIFLYLIPRDRVGLMLIMGTVLQLVSLGSSSFIEEEHQVWYFLWLTFCVLLMLDIVYMERVTLTAQWIVMLAGHRALRKWNQTGDKWASLPDFGDWLVQPENKLYYSGLFALGLLGVFVSCDYINTKCVQIGQIGRQTNRLLWAIGASCIYFYRCTMGSVIAPFHYTQSKGVTEVQIFWRILAFILVVGIGAPICSGKILRQKVQSLQILNNLVCSITTCWILLCALLHRPHDVILVPAQVLFTAFLHKAIILLNLNNETMVLTTLHIWTGMLFYFYQGNSNSLANLDIASGYAGQDEYNQIKVAILLLSNTYAAIVLSHLLLVTNMIQHFLPNGFQKFSKVLGDSNRTTICIRLLTIAVYTTLIAFQRYHLFVWTVFSPKLLYESMNTAVILFMLLTTKLLVKVVDSTSF